MKKAVKNPIIKAAKERTKKNAIIPKTKKSKKNKKKNTPGHHLGHHQNH
jgi:hypothetical protein